MRRELHFTFPRLDLTRFGRRSIAAEKESTHARLKRGFSEQQSLEETRNYSRCSN